MRKTNYSKRFYFFIGTTTELIKLAPIISEMEKRKLDFKIITSGQTKVNFDELSKIIKKKKADIELEAKTNKSSLFKFFIWSVLVFFRISSLRKEFKKSKKKDLYLIVHGDPVSSLIGAVTAKLYGLKLVHVESGLRSFNFLEPFPEEICRVLISKMTDFSFCPNKWSLRNLKKSRGIKINTFQNTMIESYYGTTSKKRLFDEKLKLGGKKYFILIVHRQEHVVFDKEGSKKLIKHILNNSPRDMTCVFITHSLTSDFLKSVNLKSEIRENKIKFASRLRYKEFVSLLDNAEFIITDGGSNQEEAYYIGLPCLLLRSHTERIEGLNSNVVLSKGKKKVIAEFMKNYKKYRKAKIKIDKSPSKIIVDTLES